jgi:cell division protein FtsI (penicillin-binding protein 3)
MVQAVYENYKIILQNLSTINSYGLNKKLNMDFEGKANCYSKPSDKNWSNISLPWMAFGYVSGNANANLGIL